MGRLSARIELKDQTVETNEMMLSHVLGMLARDVTDCWRHICIIGDQLGEAQLSGQCIWYRAQFQACVSRCALSLDSEHNVK